MAGVKDIDTVVFDLGGVLMRTGRPSDIANQFPGVDADLVIPILMGDYAQDTDHPWHRLERGEITLAECKVANRAALAAAGVAPVAAVAAVAAGRAAARSQARHEPGRLRAGRP